MVNKIYILLFSFLTQNLSAIRIQNVLKTKIKICNSFSYVELEPNQSYEFTNLNENYLIPFCNKESSAVLTFKFVNFNLIDHSKIKIINKTNSKNNLIIHNLPKNVKVNIDNTTITLKAEK